MYVLPTEREKIYQTKYKNQKGISKTRKAPREPVRTADIEERKTDNKEVI